MLFAHALYHSDAAKAEPPKGGLKRPKQFGVDKRVNPSAGSMLLAEHHNETSHIVASMDSNATAIRRNRSSQNISCSSRQRPNLTLDPTQIDRDIPTLGWVDFIQKRYTYTSGAAPAPPPNKVGAAGGPTH